MNDASFSQFLLLSSNNFPKNMTMHLSKIFSLVFPFFGKLAVPVVSIFFVKLLKILLNVNFHALNIFPTVLLGDTFENSSVF